MFSRILTLFALPNFCNLPVYAFLAFSCLWSVPIVVALQAAGPARFMPWRNLGQVQTGP